MEGLLHGHELGTESKTPWTSFCQPIFGRDVKVYIHKESVYHPVPGDICSNTTRLRDFVIVGSTTVHKIQKHKYTLLFCYGEVNLGFDGYTFIHD